MDQYRISTYTDGFGLENIAEAGFRIVDYTASSLYKVMFHKGEAEFRAYFEEEYEKMKTLGIRVGQVHAPYNSPPDRVSEEEFASFVKAVRRSFDICTIMESPYLVIHPVIFPDWEENIGRTKEINYRLFSEYCEIAEKKNIMVAAENMPCPGVPYCDAAKMLELLEKVNSPRLCVCLDTGHAHMSQEPGVTLADMARDLGTHLKVLHVHDNDKTFDQHLPPYFGNADWKAFMKALDEIRYQGTFSLEANARQKLPENLKLPFLKYLYAVAERLIQEK